MKDADHYIKIGKNLNADYFLNLKPIDTLFTFTRFEWRAKNIYKLQGFLKREDIPLEDKINVVSYVIPVLEASPMTREEIIDFINEIQNRED